MTPWIVPYADVPDTPWANGAGSTRLMWLDAAGDRRISVAMLERPADFSRLPGFKRVVYVLDPIVIELGIDGHRLTLHQHDRVTFAGEVTVALIALDRPGRVLNVMSRSMRWIPSVAPLDSGTASAGWVVIAESEGLHVGDFVLKSPPLTGAISIAFRPIAPVGNKG